MSLVHLFDLSVSADLSLVDGKHPEFDEKTVENVSMIEY